MAAVPEPGNAVTTSNFLVPSLSAASPVIVKSSAYTDLDTFTSWLTDKKPLNTDSRLASSTVILSLTMISSNTGRKFAVSPTIDSDGVSSDASSPVTADILVLPMNKSPLLLSPE